MNKLAIGTMIAIGGIVLVVIISLTYENVPQEIKESDELNPQVEKLDTQFNQTKTYLRN